MFENIESKIIKEFQIFDYDSAIEYLDLINNAILTAQTALIAQALYPDDDYLKFDLDVSVEDVKNELKELAENFSIEKIGYVKTSDFEAKINIIKINLKLLEKLYLNSKIEK